MLKVKLSPPIYENHKWNVFLDIGLRKIFPNKRAAEDHIRFIEHEFNQALLFVNEEFTQISDFYRVYFLADRDSRFKYLVNNSLDLINNRLNFISSRTESPNLNTMVYQAIKICFDEILTVCALLNNKAVQRYDMLTRNRIQLRIRVITTYLEQFRSIIKDIGIAAAAERLKTMSICFN